MNVQNGLKCAYIIMILVHTMIKRIYQRFLKNRKPAPLGRWCHKEYNAKCSAHIKSDLANMDNSGHMTGLCAKKASTISKIDKSLKKPDLEMKQKYVAISSVLFNSQR